MRLSLRLLCACTLSALPASRAHAQKPRPELADSVRNALRDSVRRGPIHEAPPARDPGTRNFAFIRDQAFLGALVYAPAFATTVANDGVAWTAGYLVVAGGTFFAAAELSRDLTITDPMRHLATGLAVRDGIAGWLLGYAFNADHHGTAGAIFLGSLGGTAAALITGRKMNAGEASAALFGADATALAALGVTAMVNGDRVSTAAADRARAGIAAGGLLLGAPIGQAYAALAPYHVTDGDVRTLWTTAGIGVLGGWSIVANSHPTDRATAIALTSGGALGILAGDRFLVRRFDHTRGEGQLLALGATAGGLIGAGLGVLTDASRDRFSSATAALTTAGMVGGIVLTERFLAPARDGQQRADARAPSAGWADQAARRVEFNPFAIAAVATHRPGTYPLVRWTF